MKKVLLAVAEKKTHFFHNEDTDKNLSSQKEE